MNILYPSVYLDSIYSIDFEYLRAKGVRGVIFDVDNTLVPLNTDEPDIRIVEFVNELAKTGLSVGLVSNSGKKRVELIKRKFNNVTAISNAMKPFKSKVLKAMEIMGTNSCNTVLVGDQIFTDVLVANRCSMMTILVKPLTRKEPIYMKLKRGVERRILNRYTRLNKEKNTIESAIKRKKEILRNDIDE
ncbi:MAG: YqeG family HAD IIIA-type phosphatase [Clostridia bacterium]|jgi:HAD superfamily phosphatase (TIGR01668 family)|nr:YqeG family HAD IIIA-type phosphatase [Clostridia bacterium]